MRGRKRFVVAAVCVLALLTAATAGARGGGVDRSFGVNGVAAIDPVREFGGIQEMAVAPDRKIYLLGYTAQCSVTCTDDLYLLRRLPNGLPDTGFGAGGVAPVAAAEGGNPRVELRVDANGGALVSFPSGGNVSVVRIAPNGAVDQSFGQGGTATLACGCQGASSLLEIDRSGRILVGAASRQYVEQPPTPNYSLMRLLVTRLLPNGAVDGSFNGGKPVEAVTENRWPPSVSAVAGDGSLVLAGTRESNTRIYLMRIGATGEVDWRFDRTSRRALAGLRATSPPLEFTDVGALVPRRQGAVDVFPDFYGDSFMLRMRPSGRLDRRFGRRGAKHLPVRLNAAVPVGAGRFFATGRDPEEGGQAAFLLNARGNLDRSFHGGRPVVFKRWLNLGGLAMQGRRPLIFDNGGMLCRSYCPPEPKLVRITAIPAAKGKNRGR